MRDAVLVTGATGFVGSALVSFLARRGHCSVVAAARTERELPARVRHVRVGELGPGTDWRPALDGVGRVIHCAARVHVMREASGDPFADYRRVNTEGTLALARQAAAAGVRRFVFLSSIKVNGESTVTDRPFRADDPPHPHGPYARSKFEAEEGLRILAKETSLEVVIIRPVLVYGPGVKGNFTSMMWWISRGIPLPLGLVRNRRSLVALDNLVDLILASLVHPGAADETFLASDGEDLSTADLLRKTAAALGRPPRLIPIPPKILEAGAALTGMRGAAHRLLDSLQVDIRKNREVLGWIPPISVEQGLARTAQYFLANRGRSI